MPTVLLPNKFKVAVIGCGNIGANVDRYSLSVQPATHAGAFQEHPRTELAALVDTNPEQLQKAGHYFGNAALFSNVQEMMKKIQPDIVSIATPTSTHASLVKEIVPYRIKAIICEKPIAATCEEAENIIQQCKQYNTPLFINHTRRFDPLISAVREKIKDIGPVLQGTAYYVRGIANNGTHLIDLLRFHLGEIEEVIGLHNFTTGGESLLKGDNNIDGFLFFTSKARVAIQTLDVKDYSIFDIHLYGRQGKISLKRFGFVTEIMGIKECVDYSGVKELDEDNLKREGETRSLMRSMAEHVVDCLDRGVRPLSSGEDGLVALKVIVALQESARSGGKTIKVVE